MWIADLCIRRPVMAVMMIAGLMVLGLVSIGRIPIDLFPNIEAPYVTVETILEGASPATVETEVTNKLEEEIVSLSGIKTMRSISSDGYSQLIIEFELEESVDIKAQEVRDKVNRVIPSLPDTIKTPAVSKVDPAAEPIISIVISGPLSIGELTSYAKDTVKERLQRITGVGSITLLGGREREIRIWLQAPKLRGFGVTVDDIVAAIHRDHADIPGGRMDYRGGRSEFIIKTQGEVETYAEFGDIIISRSGASVVRLSDVARIEDGLEDERSYAELDGQRSVSLEVRKQSGTNTVNVARGIRAELELIHKELPPGIRIDAVRDTSRFIESSVRDVSFDILLGIALVVIVTLCFLLSIRATFIVATAIPTAIISTFFAFYLFDLSINMMSLIAISLAVGLLVDDAIVVLESIYREVELGSDPMVAASVGTRKVATAVVASTISVMAVFLPIAFVTGMIGAFFYQYGMTIAVAVGLSLFVSITLTPMLSSRLLRKSGGHKGIAAVFDKGYTWVERVYVRLVRFALNARWLVMTIAALSVVVGIYFAGKVPLAFTSKTDRSEFLATIELPLGTGLTEAKKVAARVGHIVGELEHVELTFVVIGSGAQEKANELTFYIAVTPKQDRDMHQQVLVDSTREALILAVPEAKHIGMADVPWLSGGGFFSADIELGLRGPDLEQLKSYTESIMDEMHKSGMFRDINSSYESGKPEIQVSIDRNRASDLGISVRTIASSIGATMGGIDIASFEEFGERYDVRLRFEESYRDQLGKFDLIQLRASDGSLVDFHNVATVEITSGPAQIDHYNRARKISVFGNAPSEYAVGQLLDKMDDIVEGISLQPGYEASYLGASEQVSETANAILFAFGFALVCLYMILASQFNSYIQPITIMLTAPLSFVGAFTLLALTGSELSITGQVGIVALMGLVMKNGILLVDCANQAVERGLNAKDAMLEAGRLRLRPVLMTAFSTISGMVPIALATSDGSEFRSSMGIIVIGGLLSSTLMTLFVVPTAYTLFADAKQHSRKILRRAAR